MNAIQKVKFVDLKVIHLDNIGKLYAIIDLYNFKNLADKFKDNKIRIFNKAEDGKIDIKIKFVNEFNDNENPNPTVNQNLNNLYTLNIKILISSSMCPKLNATKYIIKSNCKDLSEEYYDRLTIVYFINSNLLNKDTLFENYLQSIKIRDCFKILNLNDEKSDFFNNDNLEEEFYLKSIKQIFCRKCHAKLIDFSSIVEKDGIKIKLLENFDYNYEEKLENLSCHESHTDDIIPNIEEKLKRMLNMNDSFLQVNKYLREEANIKFDFKKIGNKYAFHCINCNYFLGNTIIENESKYEFMNLILNCLIIIDDENNKSELDIEKYFKYRIYKSLTENINCLYVKSSLEDKEEHINSFFDLKSNMFLFSSKSINRFENKQMNEISFEKSDFHRLLIFNYFKNTNVDIEKLGLNLDNKIIYLDEINLNKIEKKYDCSNFEYENILKENFQSDYCNIFAIELN